MPFQDGPIVNRAVPSPEFSLENDSTLTSVNVTPRRTDSPHNLHKLVQDRTANSPDEVRALLTELRALISKLSIQQAELEQQNLHLRHVNAELENSNARDIKLLEMTGQLARVGGWELDLRSNVLFWTKETCRIHELADFETPSLEMAIEFYAPEARPIIREAVDKAIAEGTPWDLELPMVTEKGKHIWVRAQGTVLYENGTAVKLHGAFQDITERKQAELSKISLESYLRESQKLEAVGTLAGGVAHDFNNILAAIIGNADVAMLSVDSPALITRCLGEISRASSRGRELVRQILSFGRPRATERKVISITPVIEESMQLLRATLPARIALSLECSDNLPGVMVDATQLEQVVVNLATNAYQAMAGNPGKIVIKIDSVPLDDELRKLMSAPQSGSNEFSRALRLIVSDNGPGMTELTAARLFEPFFTTKPVGEGTGLGLAVVHGIIRTHQGAITVDSKPGNGATFTIYLPAFEVIQSSPERAVVEGELPPPTDIECKLMPRVLYVDDDPAVLKSTTLLMEHQGFHVSGFSDQIAAMEAFRNDIGRFDLVVADYNMPCISGIEFARFVRTQRLDIPIVIISGLIDETLQTQAASVGVQELVAKPFTLKSFCDKLKRVAAPAMNIQR